MIIILSIIGICIWVIGFILSVKILFSQVKENMAGDRFIFAIICFFVMGTLGWIFSYGGITNPVREIVISYEIPSHILKTNDITIVDHIVGDKLVCNFVNTSASFYNSTNIRVRVISGNNFWKCRVNSLYEVVNGGSDE